MCSFFCRDNTFCPADQFCNKTTGTCAERPGRSDCDMCTSNFDCNNGNGATCLTFLTEGQTNQFCGVDCNTDDDCPSGYECGGVINECGSGASCPAPPGGGSVECKAFDVENEGTLFFCTGSNGQPIEYLKSCAPRSGTCPPVAAP